MGILKVLLLTIVWSSITMESIASQQTITGSNLTNLVINHLNKKGLIAKPIINKNRVFHGCKGDDVIISKRDNSWKTVNLTCQNNKSWKYSFRNKVGKSVEMEKSRVFHELKAHNTAKKTRTVLVLKKSKLKGDKIEQSDLVLSQKEKILSNSAFEDPKLVLGKRLRKSMRKGAILKAIHLNPDWLVYKNQRIIIENKIAEIYVKMEGIALSNGAKGDRILAKNVSSNKIIEGYVESAKKISIFRKIN